MDPRCRTHHRPRKLPAQEHASRNVRVGRHREHVHLCAPGIGLGRTPGRAGRGTKQRGPQDMATLARASAVRCRDGGLADSCLDTRRRAARGALHRRLRRLLAPDRDRRRGTAAHGHDIRPRPRRLRRRPSRRRADRRRHARRTGLRGLGRGHGRGARAPGHGRRHGHHPRTARQRAGAGTSPRAARGAGTECPRDRRLPEAPLQGSP